MNSATQALTAASQNGRADVTRMLLEAGADKDPWGPNEP